MDRKLAAMVDAHSVGRKRIEDRVQALVLADLAAFDGWYSPAMVSDLVARISTRVSAGQVGVGQLTDAYLARSTSYVLERTVSGVPVLLGQTLRHGVASHEEVYSRVASAYRFQLSQGVEKGRALAVAQTRAAEMISTDMGLAFQRQAASFMRPTRRGGIEQLYRYRRIVRPELSQNGSCGLCLAASHRLYWRQDLMPIHARCRCTVMAVTKASDPGAQIDDEALSELYGAADSTSGVELKKVRVTVVEHPELGPQLRVEGQHFRGPAEVAAAS